MKNKFLENMSWILFGNIVHAIFAFLLNIVTARLLTTDDYGLLNYATSLVAFLSAVVTLGLNGMITRMFAEDESHSGEYISTGIILRLFAGILCMFAVIAYLTLSKAENSTMATVTFFQAFGVFFGAFDLLVYWFRYKHNARFVAIARFIGFAVAGGFKLISLIFFRSIVLYAVGISLETLFMSAILFIEYKKQNGFKWKFSIETSKKMLKISYPFIFSAVMVTIYGQTDKVMLRSMVDISSVAYYSVALTLAGAFSIIPSALIESFRPEIMSSKFTNESRYHQRLKQVYALVFWLSCGYSVCVAILAKPIILILYGDKYLPAVPALALVVWYSAFSYLGSINNMFLVAENKTKWIQILTLLGAVCNVLLNLLLIPRYNIVGAAAASLLTQIITNILILFLIPPLRPEFRVMIQGILLYDMDFKEYLYRIKNIAGRK